MHNISTVSCDDIQVFNVIKLHLSIENKNTVILAYHFIITLHTYVYVLYVIRERELLVYYWGHIGMIVSRISLDGISFGG